MLDGLLLLQPRTATGGGKSREEVSHGLGVGQLEGASHTGGGAHGGGHQRGVSQHFSSIVWYCVVSSTV